MDVTENIKSVKGKYSVPYKLPSVPLKILKNIKIGDGKNVTI